MYIGVQYGFYVDYDSINDSYLVYLMLHTYDSATTSGHIVRKIEPLYYENYKYDSSSGTAALEYVHDTVEEVDEFGNEKTVQRYYYKKYSEYEKIYLKDIEFGGTLYNDNHRNVGEEGYIDEADRGGYFIGGSYKFKGVSTNSHEFDFVADVFSTMIGWIDFTGTVGEVIDGIGYAVDIAKLIASGLEWEDQQRSNFRDNITNENDYTFRMVDIDAQDQIDKYEHLLKNFVTNVETPATENGLLYMIGNGNYAQSTFYCNYADTNNRWNTSFAGTVRMDIVKGNGNIIGDTVTTLAENVESNSFRDSVYKGERIEIGMDNQSELYTIPNAFVPLSFTAPANGDYTFETYGEVHNEFRALKGVVTSVGNNSKLVVRLEQGEAFNFSSVSFENRRAIYTINARFTPESLGIGDMTTIEIAPGETEYFCIEAMIGDVYSWTMQGAYVGVTRYFNNLSDPNSAYISGNSPKGSLLATSTGIYYYGITNNSTTAVAVEIAVDEPQTMSVGENATNADGHGVLTKITTPYSSAYSLNITSDANINATIYSENLTVVQQDSGETINFSLNVADTATYYLYLTYSEGVDATCVLTPTPQAVNVGENNLQKTHNTSLYRFCSADTDVKLDLSAGTLGIKVFNSSMTEIVSSGVFEKGKTYYIAVIGESTSFTLTVTPVTSALQGVADAEGFVFISYTPVRTGNYLVEGANNVEWFDSTLSSCGRFLTAGNTYYCKVTPGANATYSVQIEYETQSLSLYVTQNVQSGYYSVEISANGIYYIRINCGSGSTATGKLYNSNHSAISTVINANDGQYACELIQGKYYFELGVNGGTQASVRIMPENGNSSNKIVLSESTLSTEINGTNDGMVLDFEATKDETFYLRLTDDVALSYIVSAYNGLNEVSVISVTDHAGASDCVYVYAIQMQAGEKYVINVDAVNTDSFSCSAALFVPLKINTIKLGSEYVYQDDEGSTNVPLVMDSSYGIVLTYNTNATGVPSIFEIYAASVAKNILSVNTDNGVYELHVGFDESAEDIHATLSFQDDYSSRTVDCVIKYPYDATALLSSDYQLSVNIVDVKGNAANTECVTSVIVDCVDTTLEFNEFDPDTGNSLIFDLLTVPIVNNGGRDIEVSVIFETVAGNEYSISLPKLKYDVYYSLLANYSASNAAGQVRIVVNAESFNVSTNKEIVIPSNVKAFFIVSNSNRVFTNLKIEYQGSDKGFLYTKNLQVTRTGSNLGANFLTSSLSELTWEFAGENEIAVKTSDYIISADGDIRFTGSGSLFVSGANGFDGGANGASGSAGTNVLQCNKLFLEVEFGGELTLKGGNGGNGANGNTVNNATGNGAAGSNGNNGGSGGAGGNAVSVNNGLVFLSGDNITFTGGNGGHGGAGSSGGKGGPGFRSSTAPGAGGNGGVGGAGGAPGLGCNYSNTNITIVKGNGGWGGNGGNGGDGGDAYYATWVGGSHATLLRGSVGGNGGNGGNAGENGENVDTDSDNASSIIEGRLYGKGGNGGNGTHGASGSLRNNVVVEAQPGGNGGNGGNGYFGGNGGNGGDGGDGANGRDGSVFQKCEAGHDGAAGGNGGNGGDAYGAVNYVGVKGIGGKGGEGGNPGDPVLDKNAKGPGAKGADGVDGENGDYTGPSCVAAGTLITLADGRQVPVESLTGNELLLVWNLFTGEFDVAPILFIDSEVAGMYEVITLTFSDGTTLKVIDEHALWDFDLNEYVFMRSDAAKYIGHWFNKQTYDADGNMIYTRVQIVDVSVQTEYTSAWSPVTYGHLCFYVNGMLSMPGATTGLINIFEVDPDTMTIDEEKYLADIEMYGLFTYEEFAAQYPVPEEIFNAFGGQYLQVAMGKGLLTEDMINALIARYAEFFV